MTEEEDVTRVRREQLLQAAFARAYRVAPAAVEVSIEPYTEGRYLISVAVNGEAVPEPTFREILAKARKRRTLSAKVIFFYLFLSQFAVFAYQKWYWLALGYFVLAVVFLPKRCPGCGGYH